MAKNLVIFFASAAVALPLSAHIINVPWGQSPLLVGLFPLFGLLAFSLLWLHAISGVFEEWLRARFDFDRFVGITAGVILVSMLLHPLIVLVLVKFDIRSLLSGGTGIILGLVGLLLLLIYDIGKALKKRRFFSRHWTAILIISNIGLILAFFHSLLVGSDMHGWFRVVWYFYGISAILAIIYTYAIKPFLKADR